MVLKLLNNVTAQLRAGYVKLKMCVLDLNDELGAIFLNIKYVKINFPMIMDPMFCSQVYINVRSCGSWVERPLSDLQRMTQSGFEAVYGSEYRVSSSLPDRGMFEIALMCAGYIHNPIKDHTIDCIFYFLKDRPIQVIKINKITEKLCLIDIS